MTINKEGNGARLSANLHTDEVQCKCGCGHWMVEPSLIVLFQRMRDDYGAAISVNSGYRCPKHNANVGGAKGSYHMKGYALDLRCEAGSEYLYNLAERHLEALGIEGGVKRYEGFTHVDVRDNRWREP